MVKQICSQN